MARFFIKFCDLLRVQKSRATPIDHQELPSSSRNSQESRDHLQLEEFHSTPDRGPQHLLIHVLASKKLMLLVQVVVKLANQKAKKTVAVLVQMLRDVYEEFLEVRQYLEVDLLQQVQLLLRSSHQLKQVRFLI
jgi:hypothetical protein